MPHHYVFLFNSHLTSPHLSSSGQVAHKAAVLSLQFALSLATSFASFHDCHPKSFLSFSTVRLQVVFGRPTLLLPSGFHVIAVMQCLLSSIRRTCPIHFHLLAFTSSLILFNPVLMRISSFDTIYGHLIFKIRLKHLN